MEIKYTEEQEMLRASARDFLNKECTEGVLKEIDNSGKGYSPELWRKIAALGWLGLVFPEKYGGSGMNLIDLTVIYEELGRAMFPSPYMSTVVLGGLILLEAGHDEMKSALLPDIIAGNKIITLAINEPELGSGDITSIPGIISITAKSNGNEYVLTGSRKFIHNASIAHAYLVPAITGINDNPENSITLFLADAGSPGIAISRLDTVTGDSQYEVVFNDVRVSSSNIIGEPDKGWIPLSRLLQIGAVMSSAQMLGAGQHLLEQVIEDADTRKQYDKGSVDKYTEEYIANLRRDVEQCRQTVYTAAKMLIKGKPCDFEGSIVGKWREFSGKPVNLSDVMTE